MTIYVGTSTWYPSEGGERERLAREFIRRASELPNTVVVVVDGGSNPGFQKYAENLDNVLFYPQIGKTMHAARLEVFQHIQALSKNRADTVVWSEPEKVGFVEFIPQLAAIEADMVMPIREGMDSYPSFQALTEKAAANFVSTLVGGEDWDEFFGPVVFRASWLWCFLDFKLETFGVAGRYAGWTLNHGPRLVAKKDGARIATAKVDYRHPADQSAAEEGNLAMNLKRVEQLENLLPILWIIAYELGLVKEEPPATVRARLAQ